MESSEPGLAYKPIICWHKLRRVIASLICMDVTCATPSTLLAHYWDKYTRSDHESKVLPMTTYGLYAVNKIRLLQWMEVGM